MGLFDPQQIMNLVGQLGGNNQQAGQLLQGLMGQGQQVDTDQHAGMLQQLGIDPQHLDNGGYQQHLDNQGQQAGNGQGGFDPNQQGGFGQQQGGYDQQQGGYDQGQQGGYDQQQGNY